MSFPNIPEVDATVDITVEDSANLLLASVAFEELGLAHLINAEAEKVQYVLGTIEGQRKLEPPVTFEDLMRVNSSVDKTLRDVIKKEMLLQMKLEDVLSITNTKPAPPVCKPVKLGSAWSAGTDFGVCCNAQYTYIGPREYRKTVDLGLGCRRTDVGAVTMIRNGRNLLVSISTDPGYTMDQVELYIDDAPPTNCEPGSFPYKYQVSNPCDFFTTHTFTVDVSCFTGDTIYVAAHACVYQVP